HPLEVAEKLRQTLAEEMPRIGERLYLLVFIVKTVRDGVMSMLNLHHQIGNGELNLMYPEALAFIIRRKAEPRPEVVQDVGSLADYKITMLEKRWRELRMLDIGSLQVRNDRIWPQARAAPACDIDVIGTRLLERQPHEFAASLIGVTVVQLVSHFSPPIYCREIRFRSPSLPPGRWRIAEPLRLTADATILRATLRQRPACDRSYNPLHRRRES